MEIVILQTMPHVGMPNAPFAIPKHIMAIAMCTFAYNTIHKIEFPPYSGPPQSKGVKLKLLIY